MKPATFSAPSRRISCSNSRAQWAATSSFRTLAGGRYSFTAERKLASTSAPSKGSRRALKPDTDRAPSVLPCHERCRDEAPPVHLAARRVILQGDLEAGFHGLRPAGKEHSPLQRAAATALHDLSQLLQWIAGESVAIAEGDAIKLRL
jgi:hypothetical protein